MPGKYVIEFLAQLQPSTPDVSEHRADVKSDCLAVSFGCVLRQLAEACMKKAYALRPNHSHLHITGQFVGTDGHKAHLWNSSLGGRFFARVSRCSRPRADVVLTPPAVGGLTDSCVNSGQICEDHKAHRWKSSLGGRSFVRVSRCSRPRADVVLTPPAVGELIDSVEGSGVGIGRLCPFVCAESCMRQRYRV